ncbi:hypothetical protein T492DRAFT_859703 [Pavlovales sp. CCMP2436]|nr:hypothetical protein T492DRAFT_859703 [Pavlovales sp. CCMP2436]|mmetsp:Transcript_32737/g.76716  ORF Transcript_32737/g.76716 Transcript_32737/m.76716 type:complete len:204 (+) Transcript_32737:26-637(+)
MILALFVGTAAGAPVVWRASTTVTRRIPALPGRSLDAYFARPETPRQILTLNPGIETAEKVEDVDARTSIWEGRTAPLQFGSGVSVTSIMRFRVTFDANEMLLEVLETSTESQGPKIFTRMIDGLLPKVSSRTSMRQSGDSVTSDAYLELELPLPNWLPLPRRQIEKAGPPILEKQLGDDMSALLEAYAKAYVSAAADLVVRS